jgi:hypothetical protein
METNPFPTKEKTLIDDIGVKIKQEKKGFHYKKAAFNRSKLFPGNRVKEILNCFYMTHNDFYRKKQAHHTS